MAVEKVINIRVNDSELNQLDSNLNKVSDGFNEVEIFSHKHWAEDQGQFLDGIKNAYLQYS